jgi:predicted 3-demethylubiquinone-9 3-methyltransferase (glyoxalase superfamily)
MRIAGRRGLMGVSSTFRGEDATLPALTPCLWFDTEGEEAAAFYASVFPNSKILATTRYGSAGPRPEGS